jgi:hypothetical protein
MKYILLLLIILLCFFTPQAMVASCGAASCPLNNYHYLKAGWVGLNVVHEYINQDQIYVGSSKSFVGAIPEDHEEVQTVNERNVLQLQFGLVDNFGLSLDVPFIHREHIHIEHPNGESVWRSWNFSGLGDVVVAGHLALLLPSGEFEPQVSLLGGVKLATGVTHAKDNDGEEAEVTIQPGTGSFDGFLGFNYRQTVLSVPTVSGLYSALPLIVGATYQVNSKGKDGYKAGNILLAHVATSYQFVKRASVLLQVNGRFQDYADVGSTGEPRESTGGTWIYVSPGINLQLSDALAGTSYIQLPVYQNVHGIQQTARFNLLFSLSYTLDIVGND